MKLNKLGQFLKENNVVVNWNKEVKEIPHLIRKNENVIFVKSYATIEYNNRTVKICVDHKSKITTFTINDYDFHIGKNSMTENELINYLKGYDFPFLRLLVRHRNIAIKNYQQKHGGVRVPYETFLTSKEEAEKLGRYRYSYNKRLYIEFFKECPELIAEYL